MVAFDRFRHIFLPPKASEFMPLKIFLPLLFVIFQGCNVRTSERKDAPAAEAHPSFTDDGAWCWFSDPRAVYYEGDHKRTYSGWVDSTGNIVAGSYDHGDGSIQTAIVHRGFEKDDHDNPSFFIDEEGKLMVFYSRHATGNSPIFLARAAKPENISAWEPVQALRLNDTIAYAGYSNTYTYTNVVHLKDEQKLFLFWRGADFKPNFSVSSDAGRNWDMGKILVLPERMYRDRRPYLKVASNNKDVIHFAFTDGHPNAEPANSIYYMRYQGSALQKANGDKIMDFSSIPVDPQQVDLVYDASVSKERAWIWDVAENPEGNPVLVYATFPSDTAHVYHYAIYDEGHWNNYRLTDAGPWFPHTREGTMEREPNYSGGIVLDHSNPSHVYLSRERNGVFEIEHWTTDDKGRNWRVEEVTSRSRFDNVRPFVTRSHPGDSAEVLWMNVQKYRHYTDYRGAIKMSVRGRR